jgi:hypothetical protein
VLGKRPWAGAQSEQRSGYVTQNLSAREKRRNTGPERDAGDKETPGCKPKEVVRDCNRAVRAVGAKAGAVLHRTLARERRGEARVQRETRETKRLRGGKPREAERLQEPR